MLIFDESNSFSISQRHQYINNSIQTIKSKEMKSQRNGNWPDNSITPPFHLWLTQSLGKLEHWCWQSHHIRICISIFLMKWYHVSYSSNQKKIHLTNHSNNRQPPDAFDLKIWSSWISLVRWNTSNH